jgi:hypothetical protein
MLLSHSPQCMITALPLAVCFESPEIKSTWKPFARERHASAAVDRTLYVFGGELDSVGPMYSFDAFDTSEQFILLQLHIYITLTSHLILSFPFFVLKFLCSAAMWIQRLKSGDMSKPRVTSHLNFLAIR